jgi:hypothetical protein
VISAYGSRNYRVGRSCNSAGNGRLFKVVIVAYMVFVSVYLLFLIVAGSGVKSAVAAALAWLTGAIIGFGNWPSGTRPEGEP